MLFQGVRPELDCGLDFVGLVFEDLFADCLPSRSADEDIRKFIICQRTFDGLAIFEHQFFVPLHDYISGSGPCFDVKGAVASESIIVIGSIDDPVGSGRVV